MDSGWWEPGFSVLKWEVTDKQEKARMIHVVLAQSRRHWGGFVLNIHTGGCLWNYLWMCKYTQVIYTHVFPRSVSRQGLETTVLQQQQAHLQEGSDLDFQYYSPTRGEMADSRTEAGNVTDESGAPGSARK